MQLPKSIEASRVDTSQALFDKVPTKPKPSLYTLPSTNLLGTQEKSTLDEKQWRTEQEQFASILQEK